MNVNSVRQALHKLKGHVFYIRSGFYVSTISQDFPKHLGTMAAIISFVKTQSVTVLLKLAQLPPSPHLKRYTRLRSCTNVFYLNGHLWILTIRWDYYKTSSRQIVSGCYIYI